MDEAAPGEGKEERGLSYKVANLSTERYCVLEVAAVLVPGLLSDVGDVAGAACELVEVDALADGEEAAGAAALWVCAGAGEDVVCAVKVGTVFDVPMCAGIGTLEVASV
jgi:hypothetical protein